MSRRMTQDEMFMVMAAAASYRATCTRLQVGVVVVNQDGTKIVGMGYNGNARGLENRCDRSEPGNCGCIHAEENALIKSPYDPGHLLTLYTTHSPCIRCAKLILNSQVQRVVFAEPYRSVEGIQLLLRSGVTCDMMNSDMEVSVKLDPLSQILTQFAGAPR